VSHFVIRTTGLNWAEARRAAAFGDFDPRALVGYLNGSQQPKRETLAKFRVGLEAIGRLDVLPKAAQP
jgi:hypothetical protein